jgi:ABC-type multidrug transport system fused ATPase/permease subunit
MILLLENGSVIERGTHEELMERRGVYHDMVRRQMEASAEDTEALWT